MKRATYQPKPKKVKTAARAAGLKVGKRAKRGR